MELNQKSAGLPGDADGGNVGSLIRRISDDLQTIGRDEISLARIELTKTIKVAAAEAGAIFLAGLVAVVGLAMLCAAAVPALAPVVSALWLRMVIMAAVYMAIGAGVAAYFGNRLKQDATPDFREVKKQAQRTVQTVREGLRHG